MQASAGSLDGLVGFTFTAAQFADVTVTSFATAADGSVIDVTVALTGAPAVLAQAGSQPTTYAIAGVTDGTGQVQISQFAQNDGVIGFVQNLSYAVIGYSAGALLVATVPLASLVASVSAEQSVTGQIAAITAQPVPSGTAFAFTAGGTFTSALPCFARGTRLRLLRGEVPVERVRVGDTLRGIASGRVRRVRWVGRGTIRLRAHAAPWDVAPVRIVAGALAPGVPRRDLLLSPDHAVWIEGALIPVRYLLNGASIRQEFPATVTYLHIELDAHDVLLAEGMACESFLDTGNRAALAPPAVPEPWRLPGPVIGRIVPQYGEPP